MPRVWLRFSSSEKLRGRVYISKNRRLCQCCATARYVKGSCRIVVSTPRCGRGNLGSTPSGIIFCPAMWST